MQTLQDVFIGIAGMIGAGKSTLMKVLLGLRTSTTGQVTLGGKQVSSAGSVGYVPQDDALHRTLTDEGPVFHLPFHDMSTEATIELQVEIEHFSPTVDRVEVQLNGELLDDPSVRNPAAGDPDDPATVSENSWLVWRLESGRLSVGGQELMVRLIERDARLRVPLVIRHVEIHVTYSG